MKVWHGKSAVGISRKVDLRKRPKDEIVYFDQRLQYSIGGSYASTSSNCSPPSIHLDTNISLLLPFPLHIQTNVHENTPQRK